MLWPLYQRLQEWLSIVCMPDIQRLDNRLSELSKILGKDETLIQKHQRLYSKKGQEMAKAIRDFRSEWFKMSYTENINQQLKGQVPAPKTESLFHVTRSLMPECDRIASSILQEGLMMSQTGQSILQDLVALCNQADKEVYRPDERPIMACFQFVLSV